MRISHMISCLRHERSAVPQLRGGPLLCSTHPRQPYHVLLVGWLRPHSLPRQSQSIDTHYNLSRRVLILSRTMALEPVMAFFLLYGTAKTSCLAALSPIVYPQKLLSGLTAKREGGVSWLKGSGDRWHTLQRMYNGTV